MFKRILGIQNFRDRIRTNIESEILSQIGEGDHTTVIDYLIETPEKIKGLTVENSNERKVTKKVEDNDLIIIKPNVKSESDNKKEERKEKSDVIVLDVL